MQAGIQTPSEGRLFSRHDLAALILPLICEQLLTITVGVADSMMIATVGEAAVSGVSLVDSVMVLIINVFAALATGGAVVAGQALGQRDEREACRAGNQLILFAGAAGVGVMLLLYLLRPFILNVVFGRIEADVYAHADIYLRIVAASVPFIALFNAGAALFRTMGNSAVSMMTSLIMNIINIGGNALLIFGLKWGVVGAAVPTLVSRIAAAAIILGLLYRPDLNIRLIPEQLHRFDGSLVRKILYIGVPNGIENSMFQLGKILMIGVVTTFGTASIAANSVASVICSFQSLPGIAIGLALVTVVSRCVGAQDYAQARAYTRKLVGLAYAAMIALNTAILLALPAILSLYGFSEETTALARAALTIHGAFCMVIWPLSFTLPNALRASGDVRYCLIVASVSMWTIRVGGGYLLATAGGLGMLGVWVAMIVDWAFRTVFFCWRYRGHKWERGRL